MWETDELPKNTVMESDAALFIKRDQANEDPRPGESSRCDAYKYNIVASNHFIVFWIVDLMFHVYSVPFADNTERLGYPRPPHAICVSAAYK